MSDYFAAQERQLCEEFAAAAHGPKRNGLFALWLLLRVAGDTTVPDLISERAHRRRVEALVKRMASLTLPAALRDPLHDAAERLTDRSQDQVARILGNLVPPVRETLGRGTAAVVASAARRASTS